MANKPDVTVGAPDDVGLRKVTVNGKPVGKVRCLGELHRLLRHAGPASEHDIMWLGGDSTVWPDCAWRRRTIGSLMAAGLLVTVYVLFRIGIPDSFNSLTYVGRIAGATFLLLGLLEVIAAAAALDYWRKRRIKHSGVVVLFGVSVAFLVSSLLLLVQNWGQVVYTRYLLLWVALWVWSVCALCMLLRSRAWKGMRNPKRIAIGAMVSGLLAIANLVYSQVYIPYATSPLVQSGVDFGPPSLNSKGTKMYLAVHLSVRNSGQIPVYVLGSIYWIRGKPERAPHNKLIGSDEFVTPPGRVLNPGQEYAQDAVVEITKPDEGKYETVEAQTEVYVIRKDRVTVDPGYERSGSWAGRLRQERKDKDPQGPTDQYFRYQSGISNSDEILNLTRGPQRVTLWRVLRPDRPYLYVDVGPPGERKAFDFNSIIANQKAIKRYGLELVRGSMAKAPFVELLEQAQVAERSTR
ncbi:hypothetical protein [Streptomyces sp. NPDC048710]|uniref:hypothetical protein n=1 Tax=Streptomyces sp. NPDC048710 TaxID=3365586 RepID=UPI0037128828